MHWNLKRALTVLLLSLFIGSLIGYALYQSRGIIEGPTITLTGLEDGDTLSSRIVPITGVAKRAKSLTLDGREIFVDLSGNFNEKLLLYPGYNIIELVAKDADGREAKETLRVVWSGTSSPASHFVPTQERANATDTETITQ